MAVRAPRSGYAAPFFLAAVLLLPARATPQPAPHASAPDHAPVEAAERRFEELFGATALANARRHVQQQVRTAVTDDPANCLRLGNRQGQSEWDRLLPGVQSFAFRPIQGMIACE